VTNESEVLSGIELDGLAKKASGIFFHSQGSVTRAIQSVIDELNKDLYQKNSELVQRRYSIFGQCYYFIYFGWNVVFFHTHIPSE